MLGIYYSKQFNKDLRRVIRRGKDEAKIKPIIRKLANQETLERKHKDHKLSGGYKGARECHVEPDWLLIYAIEKENNLIRFERTGLHSDLF